MTKSTRLATFLLLLFLFLHPPILLLSQTSDADWNQVQTALREAKSAFDADCFGSQCGKSDTQTSLNRISACNHAKELLLYYKMKWGGADSSPKSLKLDYMLGQESQGAGDSGSAFDYYQRCALGTAKVDVSYRENGKDQSLHGLCADSMRQAQNNLGKPALRPGVGAGSTGSFPYPTAPNQSAQNPAAANQSIQSSGVGSQSAQSSGAGSQSAQSSDTAASPATPERGFNGQTRFPKKPENAPGAAQVSPVKHPAPKPQPKSGAKPAAPHPAPEHR